MASTLGARWKSFWHTMTSYDRHASHDSPYRTGQHVPLTGGRHAPLTSIATSGVESRPDLTYIDDAALRSPAYLRDGDLSSPTSIASPLSPYLPGMRSSSASNQKRQVNGDGTGPGEIQLQNFHQGLPPPPPVSHSWKRIDRWAEDNYEELYDQLAEGATLNDLNELEHMLDCSLPMEVRDSLQIHDGQERGGMPTGIIFGCMLLDCEEIVQEWQQWRTVNREFLANKTGSSTSFVPSKPVASSSSSQSQQTANPNWRQELLAKQDSQPSNAVVRAYSHPGWIPLARDWGGNNIAVDLAPAPAGTWGQVIIFGRDFDCKYVVARSWAAFLAMVADDLGSDKWSVDEETGELKLREFKTNAVEPGYLDILRWRMDQKYGRKVPRRRPMKPITVNLNTSGHGKNISPYGSPDGTELERGRSMHRFAGGPAAPSPKSRQARSSPLAKVAEEAPAPVTVHTSDKAPTEKGKEGEKATTKRTSKLIDAPTPAPRYDEDLEAKDSSDAAVESVKDGSSENGMPQGLGVDGVDGSSRTTTEETLKDVDL